MIEKYDSSYKSYANLELDWLPMDTKQLYDKNLKSMSENLVNSGFT